MPGKRAWSIGARECPSKQITAAPLTEPSSADWDLLDYHNRKRRWEAGKRTKYPDCLALLLHLKILAGWHNDSKIEESATCAPARTPTTPHERPQS